MWELETIVFVLADLWHKTPSEPIYVQTFHKDEKDLRTQSIPITKSKKKKRERKIIEFN